MTTHSLADTLLEVTWVDGRGKIHVSKPTDPEFNAFNGGLGMFGIITELLVQLTPPTNTELITVVKNDNDMMNEINRLLKVTAAAGECLNIKAYFASIPIGESACQLAQPPGGSTDSNPTCRPHKLLWQCHIMNLNTPAITLMLTLHLPCSNNLSSDQPARSASLAARCRQVQGLPNTQGS
jgi:hypothetical protein